MTTTPATPSGTLTRKIQRQPVIPRNVAASAKKPPMIGPSTEETPNTARMYAWYFARSRGLSMSPRIVMASDMRPPPPRPWIARYPASWYIDVAVPQSSEPTRNSPIEIRYSGLRP